MNGPILVILPHNPGDVVMALQAIRRVKARYPGLDVDYLVGEECKDLAQASPLLRKVMVIPKRALKALWDEGDADGVLTHLQTWLAELASTQYALSANLFQERSGGLLQSMVRADRKIGLELAAAAHFQVRSRFMEHLFAIPAHRAGNGWHVVDIYVRAISQALGKAPLKDPQRAAPQRRAENATSMLPLLIRPEICKSLEPGEYLAFHPGSAWAGKRWPESHWSALADRCVEEGLTLVFTGAPEDRAMMDRITAAMAGSSRAGVVDCVGATSLAGAAWIFAHARLVVSGDTVAMHLAAAAGVGTLCLFGASNPVETGPYGKGHVIIQTDANPLPELAFNSTHTGLRHLRAGEVADYLLEGVPPPGFPLWETGWDKAREAQVLFDAKRLPHPYLQSSQGLLRVLDEQAKGTEEPASDSTATAAGPRAKLQGLLSECCADPHPGNLSALEAAERELAAETQADLVWEAYRIAVNGLPVAELPAHLIARRARLQSALREEALSRPGPLPIALPREER